MKKYDSKIIRYIEPKIINRRIITAVSICSFDNSLSTNNAKSSSSNIVKSTIGTITPTVLIKTSNLVETSFINNIEPENLIERDKE